MHRAVWILPLLLLARVDTEDDARAVLDKAEAAARAGRYPEARTAYQRLAKKSPETDAGKIAVRRSTPSAFLGWDYVVQNGPSSNRVDIVLMGDGYELEHMKNFAKFAADIPPLFERNPTYREYWNYLNFLRCDLVSAENGVDGFGRDYDTALNASTGETFAGHVVIDRSRVNAMFDEMPAHDSMAICFVRNGVLGTGGGGIATIGGREATTTVHEWGHAFGRLGDEYETAQSAHQGDPSRPPNRAANVSDTEDPKLVPWAHWLEAKHPGVGVYEGAAGRVRGAWRPTSTGCTMSSGERFCLVCQEALVLRIYDYVDPIDDVVPEAQPLRNKPPIVMGRDGLTFDVQVMRPTSHALEVTWWILPEARFPSTGKDSTPGIRASKPGARDRSRRGALMPITDEPWGRVRTEMDGKHRLDLKATDLEPGKYLVVCRAKDTTKLRGEKWPWVLKDEKGLLESERAWWIQVDDAQK